MKNKFVTGKKTGLHFYNKYTEQAILALLHKNPEKKAFTFDHFPPSDVDIVITDCAPCLIDINHKKRENQLIFFLGSRACKERLTERKVFFIHLDTALEELDLCLSDGIQIRHTEYNLTSPKISLSECEEKIINHLKKSRGQGEINYSATGLGQKKIQLLLAEYNEKIGFLQQVTAVLLDFEALRVEGVLILSMLTI